MDPTSPRRKAVLFLILAATLWSTGGLMIKSTDWEPLAILIGRNLFSSAALLLYLRRFPLRWSRWTITAAACHILTAFLFISSTKLTTAANAIFLQYTAPLYIIPLGFWLLREKPSRTDWISMLVIFSGMFLFFGDKLSLNGLHGNLLAALSGLTMALMTVALRAQKDGTPLESILIAQVFTVIVGFPLLAAAILDAHEYTDHRLSRRVPDRAGLHVLHLGHQTHSGHRGHAQSAPSSRS